MVQRNRDEFIKAVREMDEVRHTRYSYYQSDSYYDENTRGYIPQPHTPGCGMCVNGVGLVGFGLDYHYTDAKGSREMCDALGVNHEMFGEIDQINFNRHNTFETMAKHLETLIRHKSNWNTATQEPEFTFDASRLT